MNVSSETRRCSSTSSSSVAAGEDVMKALMEYLVDPMLPRKCSPGETPSLPQQQSVAKQMHAVVLLYNYYYRKQQPDVELLNFQSFCELALIMKPTLMGYMKLLSQADFSKLDDIEGQLSVTEKAIMTACDISSALDASENAPSAESWEISKVAVLLTDSNKQNCFLQFSTITDGVWSLIEKDIPVHGFRFEGSEEEKHINKRKRSTKRSLKDELEVDKAGLQRLALSAVNEATGINQGDLVITESHITYSLCKEKTAAYLCIVHCNHSINEDIQLSTKDVLESLQGPLVRKSNCSLTVTPVVEYFHVLPYARILIDWFSREELSCGQHDLRFGHEKQDAKSPQGIVNSSGERNGHRDDDFVGKHNPADSAIMESSETETQSLKENNNNANGMIYSNNSYVMPEIMTCSNIVGGIHDLNNKNSQMILCCEELSKAQDFCNGTTEGADFVMNNCDKIYSEALKQKSDSLSGSSNLGKADSSMVYCNRAGETDNVDIRSCHGIDNLFGEEVINDRLVCSKKTNTADADENNKFGTNTESLEQRHDSGSDISGLPDCHTDQQNMDVDDSMIQHQEENNSKISHIITKVYHKKRTSSSGSNKNPQTCGLNVEVEVMDSMTNSCVLMPENEKADTGDKTLSTICSDQAELMIKEQAFGPSLLNAECQDKLKDSQPTKENALSQTALRYLLRKRYKLSQQLRNLEDEIALCDQNIQQISDGGANDLALKLEAVLDACYDVSLKVQAETLDWTCQQYETPGLHQYKKGLSHAGIPLQNSCQVLDDICYNNGWALPTYQVHQLNGGFRATIHLNGKDFEDTKEGELCAKPHSARESVALKILANLKTSAGESQVSSGFAVEGQHEKTHK